MKYRKVVDLSADMSGNLMTSQRTILLHTIQKGKGGGKFILKICNEGLGLFKYADFK